MIKEKSFLILILLGIHWHLLHWHLCLSRHHVKILILVNRHHDLRHHLLGRHSKLRVLLRLVFLINENILGLHFVTLH
jgi:hypothetical protein